MKVKSTMTDKNFDFNKTKDALSQLSTDLIELETIIKVKKSEFEKHNNETLSIIEEKEKAIANLTAASREALTKIENITDFINEVL